MSTGTNKKSGDWTDDLSDADIRARVQEFQEREERARDAAQLARQAAAEWRILAFKRGVKL